MRGKGTVVLVLVGLLMFAGLLFADGSDWQYFNVFNLCYGGYGTQIPSDYTTDFTTVSSFTPTRGAFDGGSYLPTSRDWSTYMRDSVVTETGVYGLWGIDEVHSLQEILIQPRQDRAVLRLDVLAASHTIYITAFKVTIWGSADFDPNEDLAPLHPDSAKAQFGVTDAEKDYYTGIQVYVDRDAGVAGDPACDVFDSLDVMAIPEHFITDSTTWYVDLGTPWIPTTAQDTFIFDPNNPTDPTLKWIQVGTESTPLGTYKKWQAIVAFRNPIAIPPQASWSGRTLPFKRIWVTLRSTGCHDCNATTTGIEGISVLDTFYVGIDTVSDFYCYLNDDNHTYSSPPLEHVEVDPNRPAPTNPLYERWSRAEWIAGQDTIKPYIYALYPHNVVGSNGPHSDCFNIDGHTAPYGDLLTEDHEWNSEPSMPSGYSGMLDGSSACNGCATSGTVSPYIYTADSVQLISFIAQDRQTCIDSAWVEIRYLNCGNFPPRIDTIFFHNPMSLSYDQQNGGHGTGWQVNIKSDGNDPLCGYERISGWGTYGEAGVEHDINGCGVDSFWIAVGNEGTGTDYLDPFLDGALVQVKVRVFNRNDHFAPFEDATVADTSWQFIVDLSGPNATLVCPNNFADAGETGTTTNWLDDETRAFRDYSGTGWTDYNRSDNIEGDVVPYTWIADSLPTFTLWVYDDYPNVHDVTNHGPLYTGAFGGSGFNQRDFEITFYVERQASGMPGGCDGTGVDILTVTEDDLTPFLYCGDYVQGVYIDETDDGTGAYVYVDFEHLYHSSRPDAADFLLNSGDVVYVVMTMFFDDPDYGQSYGDDPSLYTDIDLYPSDSWCGDPTTGNPVDPNYGTKNKSDNHVPVMDGPVTAGCAGYTDYSPDTLGIVRIDLQGPFAPDTFYYPPNGWVTSDTFQVITCDIYDQIGIDCVDSQGVGFGGETFVEPKGAPFTSPLYYGVSGVRADSIIMNIKVRGCDGSWHPEYNGAEGRNFHIRLDPGGGEDPISLPNLVVEKVRFHNGDNDYWGTRVVYDPYYDPTPGGMRELRFRPGDEVCVTVYACDNAYTPCADGCDGYGPCPHSEGGCEVTGDYGDGVQKFAFTHYVPGMNWAKDQLDADGLALSPRQIARWTFYVDAAPPKYVISDFTQCDLEWDYTIKDVSDNVGPVWCDEWVADVGALDIRITTIDNEDCNGDSVNDYDVIYINDLPVGGSTTVYHDGAHLSTYFTHYESGGLDVCSTDPCCVDTLRWGRYLHVALEEDLTDPERQAILRLYWGDESEDNCTFFEPGDSVIVEVYGGDASQVPWFPASERPIDWMGPYLGGSSAHNFVWHHEDDCYTWDGYITDLGDLMAYQAYTSWRCSNHTYQASDTIIFDDVENYASNGTSPLTTSYCDFENPNWAPVRKESQNMQRFVNVPLTDWFNDEGYISWNSALQYTYPPDLHGQYTQMDEVLKFSDVVPEAVVDADTADAILARGILSGYTTDTYLDYWARDLNWLRFRITSCTDSIVYECRPLDTLLVNYAPYARVVLFDSTGTQIWSYEDWYDCDCIHCWLHYHPLRDGLEPPIGAGCEDGGDLIIGPLDQLVGDVPDTLYDSIFFRDTTGTETFITAVQHLEYGWPVLRAVNYAESTLATTVGGDTIEYIATPVYGYLNGDSLVVITRFATRGPNQFGIDTLADFHFYAWSYNIDMEPPTGRFTSLDATTGYEEVNCVERHATNNTIRVRLESITDSEVGCSGGGTDADWTTTWPLPAMVEGSDVLRYLYHPELDEPLGLVYNPGTYYLYSNESKVIHNCADEIMVGSTMDLAAPITLYHGVDPGDPLVEDGTVFEDTYTSDTIFIADSLWAEAIIQDRLGNTAPVQSYPMGLDNGLPAVKGIAFCLPMYDTVSVDVDTVTGDTTITFGDRIIDFSCWDPSLFRRPWDIPDQDSLIGVFNFSPVGEPAAACTVYVRIWFTDNMDMRDIDPLYGHIVRFKPEGWTHWFPIIPIEAHAGFFPLADRYADYKQVGSGPVYRVASSDGDGVEGYEAPSISDIEPGWNSDREWIGYMVIAGDELMDGVATLRIQGFDDNAGNVMLDHEYPFRIETRYHPPTVGWPTPEGADISENDSWEEPYQGGRNTITGYGDVDGFGACPGTWAENSFCNSITGFDFDPTITDSIVFSVWYHDSSWSLSTIPGNLGDYHFTIDDMSSPFVWYDAASGYWFAEWPCDSFDVTDLPTPDDQQYFTVVMRACSRFYPDGYVSDTVNNVWINNKDLHCSYVYLTDSLGGEIPDGIDTLVFQVTTTGIRITLTGSDAQYVDYVTFVLVNELTGIGDTISSPDGITPGAIPVTNTLSDTTAWYDPATGTIVWDWNCEGKLIPGFYYLNYIVTDEIAIAKGVTSPTGYDYAYHNTCCKRHYILIPREAFLARGDNFTDAMSRTSCDYPTQPWADDIYPWADEDRYPNYPGWVSLTDTIVEGHPFLQKFQVTTFDNPDWTSGDTDPLRHPFTEQGGYPGDSLYVLFEVFPTGDELLDSAYMHIEDEYGGDISGSNMEIGYWFDITDTLCITDCLSDVHCYFVYPWVVDDQDNWSDGPVKITFTLYEHDTSGTTVFSTPQVSYILLDTYDPEYAVELIRSDGSGMRTCVNDSLPGEDIWVTNADTVDIYVNWLQTIFDQAPGMTGTDYIDYDPYVSGRTWNFLRMTIDGMPHHGYDTDDPNDLLEARLWHNVYEPGDVSNPFWHQPDGGYEGATSYAPWSTAEGYFADSKYHYRWVVSEDPAGNGLAKILVKGRDVAGNILDYDEAEDSRSYGKFVLIDTDPPTIDGGLCTVTSATFSAGTSAVDDNLLGGGYYDPATGSYVEVTIYDTSMTTTLGGPYPVNDDGSVDEGISTVGTGYDSVWVCATDLAGNENCALVPVVPEERCCEWDLCAGWNLVALSVVPSDLSIAAIFPIPGMEAYVNIGGTYYPVSTYFPSGNVDPNYGYLVLSPVDTVIEHCGEPLTDIVVPGLLSSWNTIGSPWDGAAVSSIITDPAGALDPSQVYTYDCTVSEYSFVSTLVPCEGHLVWLDSDVDSLYTAGGKIVTAAKKRTATPLWAAKFNVSSDALNRTLEVGVAENGSDGYDYGADLPALLAMPDGKDIYLGEHLATDFRAEGENITWKITSTTDFALNADLTGVPEEYDIFINNVNLRDVNKIDLKAGEYDVVAARKAIPTKFALGQNIPNPFNASTVVNYDVPEKTQVRVEVFDLSGHKVRTLVNGVQTPGYKSVIWDGNDDSGAPVTSGVYFYRMNTASFSETKRMILSK